MNGDLRVAFARRPMALANRLRPAWFSNCEAFLRSRLQGWVEAMTSLGRMISSISLVRASDPVTPARCRNWSNGPTASQRCLTTWEVVKRSWSRASAQSRPGCCSRRHIRRAQPRWSCWRASRIRGAFPCGGEEMPATTVICGVRGRPALMNPDMPWNEEIRAAWARIERLAASPETGAHVPLAPERTCVRSFPRCASRHRPPSRR